MFKKEKDIICVNINEDALKLSHLKVMPTGTQLLNLAKRSIRDLSDDELAKIILSIVNDFGAKKAQVVCAISSSMVTTKNIEIPSVNSEEIASIINLQAGRHTPYSREEIILDYINIGVFQNNYSKILLTIINRNIIKKQLGILRGIGLNVAKIIFVPESISQFYLKSQKIISGDAPAAIIDIGTETSEFIITLSPNIIACRSIPVGSKHLSEEGEGAFKKMVNEFKKSAESYQNEDIARMPESYILTNENDYTRNLQGILKDELKTNVKIIAFSDSVRVAESAQKILEEQAEGSFMDVVAPAVTLSECHVDFIPEEVKMQKAIESRGKEVAKLAILGGTIVILFCLIFFTKIYFKSAVLTNLKESHRDEHLKAESLEKIAAKTRIIKDYINSRLVSLDMLNELYRIIPDEIYLRSVSLDERGKITLQGTSESMSRVFSLVSSLEESPMFKSVKTTSTTAKKERGKDVAAFELSLKLESAKDEDEEEAVGEAVAPEAPPPDQGDGKK